MLSQISAIAHSNLQTITTMIIWYGISLPFICDMARIFPPTLPRHRRPTGIVLYKLPMSLNRFSFSGKLSLYSTGSARNSTERNGIRP